VHKLGIGISGLDLNPAKHVYTADLPATARGETPPVAGARSRQAPLRGTTHADQAAYPREMDVVAVGVDWYRRGWAAVALPTSGSALVATGRTLDHVIGRFPDADCIGVDMPIGFPATERNADLLARKYVGRRWPSVFMTPPRDVLAAPTYEAANVIAAQLMDGKKISKQAWALRENIFEVEAWAAGDTRIIEVHPEVSFRAMVGHQVEYPKSSWNGQSLRRAALISQGIEFPDILDDGGVVPVADILDAAAAAWSARRFVLEEAESFPEGAARGEAGAIWY
jgi:predicted RNase H-like nuclease